MSLPVLTFKNWFFCPPPTTILTPGLKPDECGVVSCGRESMFDKGQVLFVWEGMGTAVKKKTPCYLTYKNS